MPKVYNKRDKDTPRDAVYIGRPSKWGNPYTHLKGAKTQAWFTVNSRERAIESYRNYLYESGLINSIEELKGKDLVCFCAPLSCHGDILLELANKT